MKRCRNPVFDAMGLCEECSNDLKALRASLKDDIRRGQLSLDARRIAYENAEATELRRTFRVVK